MPLGDVSEQQKHVGSYYGADDTLVPSSFSAAIFTGVPAALGGDGVEIDYPGYARVTLTNNTTVFVVDTDGSVRAALQLPDATGAMTTDDGLVWVLFVSTAIDSYDFLATPLKVTGAGAIEEIGISPFIPNASSVPA